MLGTLPFMKQHLFLAVFGGIAIAALAFCAPIKVDDLVKAADKHNNKPVEVIGKVEKFEQRTSKAGNKYFVFKMKEAGSELNVYGRGEPKSPIKDGDKVKINGIFRKEKKLKNFTVKNEVDVTKVDGKPYGVSKL